MFLLSISNEYGQLSRTLKFQYKKFWRINRKQHIWPFVYYFFRRSEVYYYSCRGESEALGYFSVSIFFGQVDDEESKNKCSSIAVELFGSIVNLFYLVCEKNWYV